MTGDVTVPESAVEAASYAIALAHYAKRFGAPASDNHVVSNARASWSIFAADAKIALAAALPHLSTAIRDAALEEAAQAASHARDHANCTADDMVAAIRAFKGKSIPAPAAELRDRGKTVKPKPGAPAGGYGGVAGNEAGAVPAAGLPRKIFISGTAISNLIFQCVANEENTEFHDAIGWVGEIEDPYDGSKVYGLHVYSTEYPEDGSITLAEFPAPAAPAQTPGELVSLGIAWLRGELGEVDPKRLLLAADAIADLSQEQRGAVEVKPLEWKRESHDGTNKFAESIVGKYQVWAVGNAGYFCAPGQGIGTKVGTTIGAAKAAAQADYEARIRSALAASPVQQRGAVEVKLEDAAKAAFKQAQSIYRAEYDHFPLSTVWKTTDEAVRDGWRKIAAAALAATPVHQEVGE